MRIRDKDVVETQHVIDVQDFFLRHERSFSVLRGCEIKKTLEENRDIIFLLNTETIEKNAFFIYSVVKHFYRKAYLRAYKGYKKFERFIFILEESQNAFDSSVISKKIFNRLRKIFSVARNLGLHFVLASQRMQDLNTKIRARTRLMLGRVSLDDYELKIRRLVRFSKYKKEMLNFKRGTWLYLANDSKIKMPLLPQQDNKPFEINKPIKIEKPKKKGLWQRLKDSFKFDIPEYDISYGEDTFDQEDDEFLEDEDILEDSEF